LALATSYVAGERERTLIHRPDARTGTQVYSTIGAGSLVTEGKEFLDHLLILGAPARTLRTIDQAVIEPIEWSGTATPARSSACGKAILPARVTRLMRSERSADA
jgi:hypothetical protein